MADSLREINASQKTVPVIMPDSLH